MLTTPVMLTLGLRVLLRNPVPHSSPQRYSSCLALLYKPNSDHSSLTVSQHAHWEVLEILMAPTDNNNVAMHPFPSELSLLPFTWFHSLDKYDPTMLFKSLQNSIINSLWTFILLFYVLNS